MSLTNGVITVLPAPDGYVVDFDNPQRYGNTACYWISGFGMFFALVFLIQRLYVKIFVRRNFGIDDICLILAWIFTIVIQALIIRSFALGFLGVHAWEMPITKFEEFVLFDVYLNSIVYAPPTALAKMNILLFYNEIQNQDKWFQRAIWLVMVINVGSAISIFFGSIFACKPIAGGWDITLTDAVCINRTSLFEFTAAIAVVIDVFIIMIPIPMVVKLHMSRAKKVGLLFMFTVGSATVITSIVRLVLLITALGEVDQPWGGGPISTWICVEANLLIMCACLPTLRLFFRTIAPNFITSTSGLSGHSRTLEGSRGPGINPKRQHYGRFDDDGEAGYGMETLVNSGKSTEDRSRGNGASGKNTSSSWISEDGDSGRAIMQTTTTHIQYSNKPV